MKLHHVLAVALVGWCLTVCPAFCDTEAAFTLPSGVKVRIVEAPFDRKLFKITGCAEEGGPCFINRHIPFGIDGGMPKTYVRGIQVSYRGRTYSLDASDMYDAWGTRPLEYKGSIRYFGGFCVNTTNCVLRGLFSDGAGSFVAEWRIIDGKSVRTVLSDSSDILHLFENNIDSPRIE